MRERLLHLLRIREKPDPPPGIDTDLRTFRASRRHLYYNAARWLPKQIAGFFGLLVSLAFFGLIDVGFIRFGGLDMVIERISERIGNNINISFFSFEWAPSHVLMLIEGTAVVTFAVQFFASLLLLKLDWELRWYMVGEEFLRLREGLWTVHEQTIRIANIQNMKVKQGPIQRLFGIADLEVHTAGGGNLPTDLDELEGKTLHLGRFRGLEDARALRDRIRERLTRERGTGLGDADDESPHEAVEISSLEDPYEPVETGDPVALPLPASITEELVQAARDLRDETRTLRRAVGTT